MRIVIVGGGKTGGYLADRLQDAHHVTVVEQRTARAEVLRSAMPDVDVVVGDACEPEVLESAGAPDADLVVAVTGDDEDNLVVAMLTKVLDGAAVYARVNHPRNEWLFDKQWGVDMAFSSPAMLYGLIGRDLAFGDVIQLLDLQADQVTVEEVRLPEGATAVGAPLSTVALPPNVSVITLLAVEGGVRQARPDSLLSAGDQVLLLVQGEIDEAAVQDAFGIPRPTADDAAGHAEKRLHR
ncbi:MAG: potassium channel family protein [Coriobacteriia bacterium]